MICSEVIEHVADPKSFMAGLAKAVQPGGILILSTPQPWSLMELTASIALSPVIIGLTRGVTLAPQPPRELGIFVGLALGPMLLGHTGMNWALKFLPAYVVNLTVLGEPVGATLLGALIPSIRQIPPPTTLLGGAIVLTGVIIATGNRSCRSTGRD